MSDPNFLTCLRTMKFEFMEKILSLAGLKVTLNATVFGIYKESCLVMGAYLAVILINLWLKNDDIEICHGCQEKLT